MQGSPVRLACRAKLLPMIIWKKQSLQEEAERNWIGTAIALYN
jgi:hypothetical protein